MDKAIFQFNSMSYKYNEVIHLSRETCEHLVNVDEENVTKFDLEGEPLEELLNNDMLDIEKCFFRVFI